MAEEKAKRARRTVEDKIAEIDAKIATLEAKKQELLRPAKMKKIIEEASANMTPEKWLKNLALSFDPLAPPKGGVLLLPCLHSRFSKQDLSLTRPYHPVLCGRDKRA